MKFRILASIIDFALLATLTNAEDRTITDSAGHRLRYLSGGRFIQGTTGGERALSQAFPLSTTGQFYGNAEGPAHVTWVTKPFFLAEHEVTVGQFKAFVAATGYKTTAEGKSVKMVGWSPSDPKLPLYQSFDFQRTEEFNWRNPGFEQKDTHPVVGISWTDAQAYCRWLSKKERKTYRLPTEAEWELACRAGSTTWFSFGDIARRSVHRHGNLGNVELEKTRKHAAERQWLLNWEKDPEDGHVFTAPVGGYQANAWGFRDMHGNAWEWCQDLWLDTAYKKFRRPKFDQPNGVSVDPVNRDQPQTPANDFHAIRGGSWYNGDLFCRSASRTYWDRDDAACYIGFRVARDSDSRKDTSAADAFRREQAAIRQIKTSGGAIYSSSGLDIEVRFSGETLDERALAALSSLPNLQRLRLSVRNLDITNEHLAAISRLSRLRSLDFGGSFTLDDIDLAPLARLKQLAVLQFSRNSSLNDSHLKQLAPLTTLKDFRCYGIGGGLTDRGISGLRGNRGLSTLEIMESDATGACLVDFVGCPLTTLAVTSRDRTNGKLSPDFLRVIARFPGLHSLNLSNQTQIRGSTLAVIVRLSTLQRLNLDGCTKLADAEFGELNKLQRLKDLQLNNANAGDIAADAIGKIPRIATLRLSSDNLTDRGLYLLSAALSLQNLDIASPKITDQGVGELGRVNRLEKLVIRSPKVKGPGLRSLASLPYLRDLSLITPGLTDNAFEHLVRAKSLQKLRLAHRGFRPPAALTDEGMMKLASATWLREIWLPRNDTGMTEAKMQILKQSLPKTNVIPYTVQWKK